MADITLVKISALPAAEQIGAEDLLPVVQEGATKAVAYGVIKDDIAEELAPDATLSEAGKAADAKAVGDALALKADKTELTAAVSRIDAALATKANTNDVTAALATKANAEDVTAALALKADTATVNAELATKANTDTVNAALALKADKTELTAGLATKQDTLTFDNTPIEGSTNPVTSGGVYTEVAAIKSTVGALEADKEYLNLFDAASSEIVALNINTSTLKFGTSATAKSVVVKCKPNTAYSIAWRATAGNARFFIGPSANIPVAGGTASARYEMDTTVDNRKTITITTGETDEYMLFWFFTGNSGYEATYNSIQYNEGSTINDYAPYGYIERSELLDTSQLYGAPIATEYIPDYVTNLLGYRAMGTLSKGYVCIVADDGTTDVANVSFPIAQNKNVPITFALWTNSQCIVDTTLREQLISMIANYGCSVCQHGAGSFVTDYTPEALVSYLQSEMAAWSNMGIEVKGLAYPNHDNNGAVRSVCGSLYGVCCAGGSASDRVYVYPNDTLGKASNIFALFRISTYTTSLAQLKAACDYASANKKLVIMFYHDTSLAGVQAQIDKVNDIIDYAAGLGLEFVTVGDIPYLE